MNANKWLIWYILTIVAVITSLVFQEHPEPSEVKCVKSKVAK